MWRFMGGRFSRSTRCMSSSSRAVGWWEHVSPAPKDPITGVTEAFLADTNPNKINLGVGAYWDDQGKPVVLQCVRNAEAKIAACEFPESNATAVASKLVEESVKLAYGTHAHVVKEGRVAGLQALSGTVRVVSLLSFRGVSILDHQFIYLTQHGSSKFAL
ncbi:aspartate aminotransferase, mitochondrial-like [Alnus glutinosa]|uniref:aspartate aminotransferase, mitochondrial-like n=1 Tax=Alnus glutinosa TaxID=3517 RepID=UPI002D76937E|nr:aspartate aminotransferase, mitochondrial-like [Alnus glutinosa]